MDTYFEDSFIKELSRISTAFVLEKANEIGTGDFGTRFGVTKLLIDEQEGPKEVVQHIRCMGGSKHLLGLWVGMVIELGEVADEFVKQSHGQEREGVFCKPHPNFNRSSTSKKWTVSLQEDYSSSTEKCVFFYGCEAAYESKLHRCK